MKIRLSIASVLLLAAATAAQEPKSPADTLGIKRVLVPAGTKFDDLIKAEGTLVEVPLAALETRLEQAAKAQLAAKQIPRLVKATYRAELLGNQLTRGSSQWVIEHVGAAPAVFPLGSFNLALRQPRLEGQEAVLGELDGANLGLWIEKPGRQTLLFDWSLRGTPGVQGIAFDLRIPPCPLVSLELKLPADQALTAPKLTGLLTGPHETENPAFKLWRLQVTGRSQVELTVRHGNEARRSPRFFISSTTLIQLTPEHTLYDTDAQVEVLHTPVSELVFEIDPALQPFEVSSRQTILSGWRVEPATKTNNRALLKVQLREPLLGVLNGLRLRFHGPRWTDQEQTAPRLDIAGAFSRVETLKLHLHPDQHLERWNAGSFRLVNSSTESDGSQVLTLSDTQPDGQGTRPRFAVRSGSVDFTVNQDTRWRLDPSGMTLTSEIQYDLARGQLFALEARLPQNAAWRVVNVDLKPREALRKWSVAGGVLHVDLQSGITPRSDCKLIVQLEDDRSKALLKPKTLDFPDLTPLGAKLRQGTLAILADPHQHVSLAESNVATSRPDPNLAKDPRLQFFFAYRQTPAHGQIKLSPQQPVLEARTQEQVTLTPDSMRVKAIVSIEPIVGQPTYVDLYFSGSNRPMWKIEAKGAEIARKERLAVGDLTYLGLRLAASNAPSRAVSNLLYPRGPMWRIHFREPLTKAVELIVQQEIPAPGGNPLAGVPPAILHLDHGLGLTAGFLLSRVEREWRVPIVVALDAARSEGEVSLQPLGTALTNVQSRGLDSGPTASALSKSFARLFRFKNADLLNAPALRVKANRRLGDDAAQAILDVADLATTVDPAGNALHQLRISVWNWRARDFRVVLPAPTTIVGARLNQAALDRVPRSMRVEGLEVLIPMSQGPGPQSVELTYRTEPAAWFGLLGQAVSAPLPKLPLTPLVVHRSLHLSPDWLPLRQEEMFSLDRQAPAQETLHRVWRLGENLVDEFWSGAALDWIEPQRLSLLRAEGILRRNGPREMSLAEAFSKLMEAPQKNPLVVDRTALRALGLSPQSTATFVAGASAPFWESLGLVYVPTPQAALLTSKDRAAVWAAAIRDGNLTAALLAAAIGEGFAYGQNASGEFCAVDYWLRHETAAGRASAAARFSGQDATTVWRPLPGRAGHEAFVVVRLANVRRVAAILALVIGGIGLALRRAMAPPAFFRVSWLALAGCVLGLVAAPLSIRELALGPLAVVGALLVLSYSALLTRAALRPAPSRPSRSTQKVVKAALTGLLLAAMSLFGLCRAQGPEARTIFLLESENGPKQRAFLRPELLAWIEEQEKQARSAVVDAVFLSARYQGNWSVDGVSFRAEFEVVSFKDQASVVVPLAGVDLLEGSELDGAPIFPVVASSGKAGYQVVVPKKGSHRLTLAFLARPVAAGELKFSGPATPCSSLQLTLPTALGVPRLARGWGEVALRRNDKKSEQTLEAQLGYEPVIHVQGLSAAPAAAGGLHVRELYSWDLRPGYRSAQGLLAYRAVGEVNQLEVQIPQGLEIRSVELAEAATAQPVGSIKAWRMTRRDDNRILQVDFLQPISGSFQLLLGMAPRLLKGTGVVELRLPLPLRAQFANGMIGVRFDELEAIEKGQSLALAAHAPDSFVKEWALLSSSNIGVPLHAYSFARAAKSSAAATFEIVPQAAKPIVQSEATWTAMPQTVDLVLRLNVSTAGDLFMVPINLSESVTLRDVQGADVHHWSRQGNKLHVWLVGPKKKTAVTLVGWVPHSHPKSKNVTLPTPTVSGATLEKGTLILASGAGLALEPAGMAELIEEAGEAGQRRFRSATGRFPPDFQLRTRSAPAEFQTLTTAEVHGGQCALAVHVQGRLDFGQFPELQIRLSNWPASAPRLVLAAPGAQAKMVTTGRDHVWTITIPRGTPQQISFSLKGQMPVGAAATFALPVLRIERGGRLGDAVVAVAGAQFTEPLKTAAVRAQTKELMPWPLEHARLRAAGAQYVKGAANEPWPRLQPRETISQPPAQILSAEHRVLVGEQNKWLHRMTWSLWTTSGHDLEIVLPRGAALAAAFLDDQPATPRQTSPEKLSLPVAAGQRPRTVVVCWTYPAVLEPFAQPRLASAKLAELPPAAVLGELHVPTGWSAVDNRWVVPQDVVLLHGVQAESRALQILGEDLAAAGKAGQGPLVQALQTFAALVEDAEYRLAADPRMKALVEETHKRAKDLGLDAARSAAEKAPWLAAPRPAFCGSESGAPLPWLTAPGETEPRVDLRSKASVPPLVAIVPLAAVVFALSFWTLGLSTWISLWPEQLAAVLVIGFALGGVSVIGIGLLTAAILGRSLRLIHRVRGYNLQHKPDA